MNRINYIKQVRNILKEYNLDNNNKTMIMEQVVEVITALSDEGVKELDNPEKFVKEILELNEINVKKNVKSKNKFHIAQIIWGLFLIVLGLNFIVDFPFSFIIIYILGVLFILGIYNIFLKRYMLGILLEMFFLFIVSTMLNLNIGFFLIGITFILLGINHFFPSKNKIHGYKYQHPNYLIEGGAYQRRHQGKANKGHYRGHHGEQQFLNSEEELSQNIEMNEEKEVIIIENRGSNTKNKLVNEEINYIFIDNAYGNLELDLSNFTFQKGNLTIEIENLCGNTEMEIPQNTYLLLNMENKMGNIENNTLEYTEEENKILIIGSNKMGNIVVK